MLSTVASNYHGVNPITSAKRWSAAKKQEITICQPNLISKYNYGMGGTDRMDQNVNQYRIWIRSKKWWWPLFSFLPDVAIQNAWQIYRKSPAAEQQPLNLLQFRRAVVQSYVMQYRSRPDLGRPVGRSRPLDERLPTDVRYDGLHHYIDPIPTQRRCAHCGMKAKTVCCKCAVPLHDRCFRQFHHI